MGKNWVTGFKKAKKDAVNLPRTMEEISKEYTDLCSKLGHAQYQVSFNQRVVASLIEKIEGLDKEAGARKSLNDMEAKSATSSSGAESQPQSGAV